MSAVGYNSIVDSYSFKKEFLAQFPDPESFALARKVAAGASKTSRVISLTSLATGAVFFALGLYNYGENLRAMGVDNALKIIVPLLFGSAVAEAGNIVADIAETRMRTAEKCHKRALEHFQSTDFETTWAAHHGESIIKAVGSKVDEFKNILSLLQSYQEERDTLISEQMEKITEVGQEELNFCNKQVDVLSTLILDPYVARVGFRSVELV